MNGILPELTERFKGLRRCAICFSGGLDSTVLLRNAAESISGHFSAVFVRLPMNSSRQIEAAIKITDSFGVHLHIVDLTWDDLHGVEKNGPDRCYHCKRAIYKTVREFCDHNGLRYIIAGENADDPESERPGYKAGVESNVICPLKELGIGRDTILRSIQEMTLPVEMIKDTCMATRYPVGIAINEEMMRFVEECEKTVRTVTGIHQIRVRIRGDGAVLQTDMDELSILKEKLPLLTDHFSDNGLKVKIDDKNYNRV